MISLSAIVWAVFFIIIAGLIIWLLKYLIDNLPIPAPFKQVGNALLLIVAVFLLISVLLHLAGIPIVRFGPC